MQMLCCLPLLVENIVIWHLRDCLKKNKTMYLTFFILGYRCDGLGCILIWGAVCDSHGILKNIISFELLLQVINIPSNIRDKELYLTNVFYIRCFMWFLIIFGVYMHWNCCSAWVLIARVQYHWIYFVHLFIYKLVNCVWCSCKHSVLDEIHFLIVIY